MYEEYHLSVKCNADRMSVYITGDVTGLKNLKQQIQSLLANSQERESCLNFILGGFCEEKLTDTPTRMDQELVEHLKVCYVEDIDTGGSLSI